MNHLIIFQAFHLFFNDSDEDDDDYDQCSIEPENYAEKVVPRFSSQTFKKHFRVERTVFEIVCKDIYHCLQQNLVPGRKPLNVEKQLMITLWYLGNQERLVSISERFGVHVFTTFRVLSNVCRALLKINGTKKYVKWPTTEEARMDAEQYYEKYKLPGIVGCIGCTHIRIRRPTRDSELYANSKGSHSILLQGVCNKNSEFLHFYAGEFGSLDNATLMGKSGLEDKINSGHLSIAEEQHLLGDSTYPLKEWLMPPYLDNENLEEHQEVFNAVHSLCLSSITHTFDLLKGRFRRLFYVEWPTGIVEFIVAACILHNICLQNEDFADEFVINEIEAGKYGKNGKAVTESDIDDDSDDHAEFCGAQSAKSKRDKLMDYTKDTKH